jgi:predicted Ser/Thr protein kinase
MASTDEPCPRCGKAIPADSGGLCLSCLDSEDTFTALAPRLPAIPGYRMLRPLGEGGMGTVFLAEDETLHRTVAIKLIARAFAPESTARERFLREARAMAKVEHPAIVRVYSFGRLDDNDYLVMEYVEGQTLRDVIRARSPMPWPEALRITRQVLEALQAAWERGVVHRDVKPSNVLVDRKGRVRVADFGLAKSFEGGDASLTQAGDMVGTPAYVAPEQARGTTVDLRTDLYATGIVLWEMLTGEVPFRDESPMAVLYRHLHEDVPPLPARLGAPPAVAELVAALCRRDPELRPASYEDALARLDAALGEAASGSAPRAAATAAKTSSRSRRAPTALAAMVLAAGVATAWWVPRLVVRDEPVPAQPATAAPFELRIVVLPFYGPDDLSAREGRQIAALVEGELHRRLGDDASIVGLEETEKPVRSHDEAIARGRQLGASIVLWGEALAVRDQTEITPSFTVIPPSEPQNDPSAAQAWLVARPIDTLASHLERLADTPEPVRLDATVPDQIALRKTTASGMGAVVAFLAGVHWLNRDQPQRALPYLEQAPPGLVGLRYRARALARLDRAGEARALLEGAAAGGSLDAQSLALLGDLRFPEDLAGAADAYGRAIASGQAFSSREAVLQDGLLYHGETFAEPCPPPAHRRETPYLLAVEPATGRVVRRLYLPGLPRRFDGRGGDVDVVYKEASEEGRLAKIGLARGELDRPVYFGGNYQPRLIALRAGRAPAANFADSVLMGSAARWEALRGYVRFGAANASCAAVPTDLGALERALRAAADHDPTQPMFPLYLGFTLAGEGRQREAAAAWEGLAAGDWKGVPHFELMWIAELLDRVGETRWSDALAAKALARRRQHPQPIWGTTLIGRLISAPLGFRRRMAPRGFELERAYLRLNQAREVTGPDGEVDSLAAALWADHFAHHGRADLAARERVYARRARDVPFAIADELVLLDYAANLLRGTTLATLLLGFGLWALAGRLRAPALGAMTAALRGAGPPQRIAIVASVALVLGELLLLHTVTSQLPAARLALVAASVALGLLVAWGAAPALRGRAAVAVVALAALAIGSLAAVQWWGCRLASLMAVPGGLEDSLGHPSVVRFLDQRGAAHPSAEGDLLAGVAHQLAGDRERAAALYRQALALPEAAPNLRAVAAGASLPARWPTPRQVRAALLVPAFSMLGVRLTWQVQPAGGLSPAQLGPPELGLLLAAAGYFLASLALLALAPRRLLPPAAAPDPTSLHRRRSWQLALPGLPATLGGRSLAAAGIALAFALPVASLATLARSSGLGFGPATTAILPSLDSTVVPLAVAGDVGRVQLVTSGVLWLHPFARPFWASQLVLLVAAVTWQIREWRRLPGGDAPPSFETRAQPVSP